MVSFMQHVAEHTSILRTQIIIGVNKNKRKLMLTKYKVLIRIDLHISPTSISDNRIHFSSLSIIAREIKILSQQILQTKFRIKNYAQKLPVKYIQN